MKAIRMIRNAVAYTLLAAGITLAGGCATPPAHNSADNGVVQLDVGNAQNAQFWSDGSGQTGSTQLDTGVINSETIDFMGTAVSGILSVNKNGVAVKNPGNFSADSFEIRFREAIPPDGGEGMIVPIEYIIIEGLTNEVTTVIEASSEQVAFWATLLADVSEDQRDVAIEQLKTQGVITEQAASLIRAALEAASPVP
jgi:hypothetical protein